MTQAIAVQPDPRRFATERAFEDWLRKNCSTSEGIWLLIAKPGADEATVTYAQAVEVALCYGWIDGQKKALDTQHSLLAAARAQLVVEGQSREGGGVDPGGSDPAPWNGRD
jgi:uncharacterized protein YdeI (YjbR/CyaY-like superfamily)